MGVVIIRHLWVNFKSRWHQEILYWERTCTRLFGISGVYYSFLGSFCYIRCLFFLSLQHRIRPTTSIPILSQRLPSKSWQHKTRFVDILIIVPTQLLLFLLRPTPKRCLEISLSVLAADHESNLARWVSGDGSVGILDSGEDFLA